MGSPTASHLCASPDQARADAGSALLDVIEAVALDRGFEHSVWTAASSCCRRWCHTRATGTSWRRSTRATPMPPCGWSATCDGDLADRFGARANVPGAVTADIRLDVVHGQVLAVLGKVHARRITAATEWYGDGQGGRAGQPPRFTLTDVRIPAWSTRCAEASHPGGERRRRTASGICIRVASPGENVAGQSSAPAATKPRRDLTRRRPGWPGRRSRGGCPSCHTAAADRGR